jgi:hypothetical protein
MDPPSGPACTFLVHQTPTDGSCCFAALLELLRALFENCDSFVQAVPIDTQHLRDELVDFIVTHADAPCAALADQSFRSGIRQEYVVGQRELRDSDYYRAAMEADEDPVLLVHSFVGWCHAMRRPRAHGDEFIIAAFASAFNIQTCVLRKINGLTTPTFYATPGASHLAVLLADNDHFEWCSVAAPVDPSSLRRITVEWNPPALLPSLPAASQADLAVPPHLDDSQPLSTTHREAIARAHNAVTGHPGRDATLAALRASGYSWRGMFAEVSKFVDRCPSCHIARRAGPVQAHHRTLRASQRVCRRWHVDTIGPFPECSATGFRFISLFIDEMTGYTLLFGAKTKCALKLAVALLSLTGLFGLPDSIHSDGGSEFDTDVLHQFSVLCSVCHNLSTARAPNTNGLAERQAQLSKRMLRQMHPIIGTATYWGLLIPLVQRATNFLHRGDMGCCPQQFVFGLAANMDAFVIPCSPATVSDEEMAAANSYHPSAGLMHTALRYQERILQTVLEFRERHFEAAQRSSPAANVDSLSVGDLVLIPWRDITPPTALHPRMCGPYVITNVNPAANTIALEHISNPPPQHQLRHTSWSCKAGVHLLSDFQQLPLEDPSSSGLAVDRPFPQPIDCILSCSLLDLPLPQPDAPAHVSNHRFLVRWLGKPQAEASYVSYDTVKHTVACDRFCSANPSLLGHASILRPPSSFEPQARPAAEHSSAPLVATSEAHLPEGSPNIRVPHPTMPHRGRPAPAFQSQAIPPAPRVAFSPDTPPRQPRGGGAASSRSSR